MVQNILGGKGLCYSQDGEVQAVWEALVNWF